MGNFVTKLIGGKDFWWFGAKKRATVFMLGLDAAGKTTVLYRLKLGEVVTTIPTIGFNVEAIAYKGLEMMAWDVGGRGRIRALYRHYFQQEGPKAVMYVVDSNDRERMVDCREELIDTFTRNQDSLGSVPLVVLANKQDLPNAMRPEEVFEALGLAEIARLTKQPVHLQAACAITGDGLYESLALLHDSLYPAKQSEIVATITANPDDADKQSSSQSSA